MFWLSRHSKLTNLKVHRIVFGMRKRAQINVRIVTASNINIRVNNFVMNIFFCIYFKDFEVILDIRFIFVAVQQVYKRNIFDLILYFIFCQKNLKPAAEIFGGHSEALMLVVEFSGKIRKMQIIIIAEHIATPTAVGIDTFMLTEMNDFLNVNLHCWHFGE